MASGEATFKSNILVREEKGFFGIPFKRIMLAFMAGAMIYMVSNFLMGSSSLVLGIVSAVLTVILTQPRGGIPLWQRLQYRARGSLIMAQVDAPDSIAASLGKLLELHTDMLVLSGADLFHAPDDEQAEVVDWSQWLTYTDPAQVQSGEALQIVEGPADWVRTPSAVHPPDDPADWNSRTEPALARTLPVPKGGIA